MDDAVTTTVEEKIELAAERLRDVKNARESLQDLLSKYDNVAFFRPVSVTARYNYKRDGGDASILGDFQLVLAEPEIRDIIEHRIDIARSHLEAAQRDWDQEIAKWGRR